MKLSEYHGPLWLVCFNCNTEVSTIIRWDKKVVVNAAAEKGQMDVEISGRRHCPLCNGTKLGIERIVIELELDAANK